MIRGTTALHTFKFPDDIVSTYINMLVTYRQNGEVILEKQLNDLDIDGNVATYRFTQRETLAFETGTAYVQTKVFDVDGHVKSSASFSFPVTSTLSDNIFLDNGYIDTVEDTTDWKSDDTFVIVRGTTPTFYYAPTMCPIEEVDLIYLVIKQHKRIAIEKDKDSADIINDSMFAWELSQEETLSLQSKCPATVSCVWKLVNGIRGESQLTCCKVIDSAIDEVI